MSGCPRMTDIAHCPLYIESHNARQLGCVDYLDRPCKVSRGIMGFDQSVWKLASMGIAHPGMIESLRCIGSKN
jgi:hypothetical protein